MVNIQQYARHTILTYSTVCYTFNRMLAIQANAIHQLYLTNSLPFGGLFGGLGGLGRLDGFLLGGNIYMPRGQRPRRIMGSSSRFRRPPALVVRCSSLNVHGPLDVPLFFCRATRYLMSASRRRTTARRSLLKMHQACSLAHSVARSLADRLLHDLAVRLAK